MKIMTENEHEITLKELINPLKVFMGIDSICNWLYLCVFIYNRTATSEMNNLRDEIKAYKENMMYKDEAIIDLNNRLAEIEVSGPPQRPRQDSSTNTSIRSMVDVREVNKLKVSVSLDTIYQSS